MLKRGKKKSEKQIYGCIAIGTLLVGRKVKEKRKGPK